MEGDKRGRPPPPTSEMVQTLRTLLICGQGSIGSTFVTLSFLDTMDPSVTARGPEGMGDGTAHRRTAAAAQRLRCR